MADIIIEKKINGVLTPLYPKTHSDLVDYDEENTVKEKITEIDSAINESLSWTIDV